MNPELVSIAEEIEGNPYEKSGYTYHPIPFPEFQHLTVSSNPKATYRKWSLIKRALMGLNPTVNLSVLDVGANAGYFSFKFAKIGATVDAFEPHEHYAVIGQKIARVTDLDVNWYNKPLLAADIANKHYNICLMLSVYQWISHGNEYLEEAKALLTVIAQKVDTLFFELGCNHGKSAISIKGRPRMWILNLLVEASAPKTVSYLGQTSPWRGGKRYLFACHDDPVQLSWWQRSVTYGLNMGVDLFP